MQVFSSFTCKRFPTRITRVQTTFTSFDMSVETAFTFQAVAAFGAGKPFFLGYSQSSFTGPNVVCEPCEVFERPATFFAGIHLKNIFEMLFKISVCDILFKQTFFFLCNT